MDDLQWDIRIALEDARTALDTLADLYDAGEYTAQARNVRDLLNNLPLPLDEN